MQGQRERLRPLTLNSPPNSQLFRKESLRRAANRRFRESRLNPGAPNIDTLSINDGTTHKPALLRKPSGDPIDQDHVSTAYFTQ